jgi:hypothetical protein
MRVEDASLNEIVTGFLDLTRGKEIPTGSVILLYSASHLLLRGVAGYMADYMEEVGRINSVFQGGLICSHGIPILSSGIKDSSVVRAILELGEWLKISGKLFPQKSWMALSSLILLEQEQEETRKPKFLVIGVSHALLEGEVLAGKGYDVITCAVSGWRANKTASEEMAEKVQEALRGLCEDNIIVVHCCDNTAFMARTEDSGDLPIRRLITGEFHV